MSENIVTDPSLRMRMGLKKMWEGHSFTCIINLVHCSIYKLIPSMSVAPTKCQEIPVVWSGESKLGYRIRRLGLKPSFTCYVIFSCSLIIPLVSSSVKWGQLHLLHKAILREEWYQKTFVYLVDTKISVNNLSEEWQVSVSILSA